MQTRVVAFTTFNSTIQNVLKNKAHVGQAFNPQSAPKPLTPQNCGAREFSAIWDTGATNTVITNKVVTDCGLKPTSMVIAHTVGGSIPAQVYLVSLFLPNKVVIPALRVLEGTIVGDAGILIGMDVINRGDFAVSNSNGRTVFSFRMPSVECIDFIGQRTPVTTSQTAPNLSPKVGRNAPCPCGSGKKYKRCCGK